LLSKASYPATRGECPVVVRLAGGSDFEDATAGKLCRSKGELR
jgi:hypothetical protein